MRYRLHNQRPYFQICVEYRFLHIEYYFTVPKAVYYEFHFDNGVININIKYFSMILS